MRATNVLASLAAVLCACGSSGGGGSTGGGAGGGLQVTPGGVAFTRVAGGPAAPAQTLTITWTASDAYALAAGYLPGTTPPSWLSIGQPSGSGQSRTLSLGVSTSAAPGTYTTTVRVGIARQDQSVIGTRDVAVTYVVKSFGATPDPAASSCVFGSSLAPAPVTLTVSAPAATAWTASADQAWVHLSATSGTTPSQVILTFDPAGLAVGTHAATVTFTSAGGPSPVAASLEVRTPSLLVSPPGIELAGLGGHDLSPKKLELRLDTGTNAYPVTVTPSDAWMVVAAVEASASATPARFTIAPSAAAAARAPGTTSGSLTVTADVNGLLLSRLVPVGYTLDDVKLVVSHDGVALTSTPTLSLLSRSLRVSTNRGLPVAWTASSDRSWLTVTASGSEADPLVLTADPTSLAADTLHEAKVTVTTADAGVADPSDAVQVGLWVGSTTPAATSSIAAAYREIVMDPVRPYAYVHSGGPAITIYNVYTGAVVGTIADVALSLGSMAVAGDGSRLYAVGGTGIVPVALRPISVGTSWPVSSTSSFSVAHARANKLGVVLTSAGTAHAADTGTSYGTFPVRDVRATLAASRNGTRLCAVNQGLSPYTLECRGLDSTTTTGLPSPVVFGTAQSGASGVGSNGADVAVSPDGTLACVAAGAPYELTCYDTTALGTLPVAARFSEDAYPTAVDVSYDGRWFGGTTGGSGPTAWAFGAAGSPIATWREGFTEKRLLGISGDGLRLVLLTGSGMGVSGAMRFLTVP